MVTPDGEIAGHIEFFKPVNYWDAFELSYLLYDERFAGHGYATEAVQLLVDYLFSAKKTHRIQLDIVPENAASRRIAEKCGFVLEGTMRGALFNGGRNQDIVIYSLLRTDPRPWHGADSQPNVRLTRRCRSRFGRSPSGCPRPGRTTHGANRWPRSARRSSYSWASVRARTGRCI